MLSKYSFKFRPWQAAAGAVLSLFVWASWDAPEMHHFAHPVEMAVWQLAPLSSPAAAKTLEAELAAEPGVSACAVSTRTGCVALVYHPEQATPDALYEAVGRHGARVVNNPPPPTTPPAIRQCPVPVGYLLAIDRFRFSLNLRRLFVSV
jgi:hypothetical protein